MQPLWRQSSIRSSSPPAASRLECVLQQSTDRCHQMQPKVAKLASVGLCDERFEELNTRMINTTNRTVSRSYQNGLDGTRFITNTSSKTFLLNRKEIIYFFYSYSLRMMYLFLFTASSSSLTSVKENLGLAFNAPFTPPTLSSSSSSRHVADMAPPLPRTAR